MSRIIRVRNESAKALAEALSEALVTIVTKDNINRILTDQFDTYKYQHVHPHGDGSALGNVHMLTTGKREDFAVTVSMGYGGIYHSEVDAVRHVGERGQLRLTIARSVTRVDFVFDHMNHEYRAVMNIPARLSKVIVKPMIELR